jgi:hypothetical protein
MIRLPGHKIYLAARYSRRLELCGYRDWFHVMGYVVTSRWLNGSHQLDDNGVPIGDKGEKIFESHDTAVPEWRRKFATDDRDDVLAADTLVHFTEVPRQTNSRGGRHVEMGIALGARKNIIVVGPREHVFTWLPEVEHYDTWDHLVMAWTESVFS